MSIFGIGKTAKSTEGSFEISLAPEDKPKFARTYVADLPNGRSMRVTMKSYFSSGRSDWAELHQPNGNYVVFDINRIADKILDPVLVPLVERLCDELNQLDAVFVKSRPGLFTDENGDVWVKQH